MDQFVSEMIFGLVLGGFAWAFQAWARTLRSSTAAIMEKLQSVGRELHDHRVESQIALARLDERVKTLESKK